MITDCTKAYFRNIHKQFLEHHDDDKARKATERKNQGRRRSRRQTVSYPEILNSE
jgi:hypothetical protein